MPKPSNIRL